jgi:peroxiredoxin
VIGITSAPWADIVGRVDSLRAGLVLLSDPDLETIDAYGLTHGTLGLDLARPGAFLVGEKGRVKWRVLPKSWRHRLNAQAVLDLYKTKETP